MADVRLLKPNELGLTNDVKVFEDGLRSSKKWGVQLLTNLMEYYIKSIVFYYTFCSFYGIILVDRNR
jgi:hypothetical protein